MIIPSWAVLAILIVIVLFIMFRTMNEVYILSLIKQNFFWYFTIALVVFITFSLFSIHKAYNLDLTTFEGIKGAGKVYFGWIVNVGRTIGKVVGYASQQEWVATNSTK